MTINEWASFTDGLREVCKALNPKHILEWGPGDSTKILTEECPDAKILSIEHEDGWYNRAVTMFDTYPNVTIKQVKRPSGNKNEDGGYASYPLHFLHNCGVEIATTPFYDLIFVDGRDRVDCLATAYLLVKDDGLVVLHDAQRERYLPGINMFAKKKYVEEKTIILAKGDNDVINWD